MRPCSLLSGWSTCRPIVWRRLTLLPVRPSSSLASWSTSGPSAWRWPTLLPARPSSLLALWSTCRPTAWRWPTTQPARQSSVSSTVRLAVCKSLVVADQLTPCPFTTNQQPNAQLHTPPSSQLANRDCRGFSISYGTPGQSKTLSPPYSTRQGITTVRLG